PPIQPPHAATRALRILLAEDNAVNQMLAVRLLEKRGHSVIVASDGKQAVAAAENDRFDAILMDVQMPQLNGFEATAAIRAKEATSGGHIPIIGMTAHPMKDDGEKCVAAGMDGSVCKPVQAAELYQAIASVASAEPSEGESPPVWNRAKALAHVGGDRELLRELAGLFLVECPRRFAEIR